MESEILTYLAGTSQIITASKDTMWIKLLKAAPSEKVEFLSWNELILAEKSFGKGHLSWVLPRTSYKCTANGAVKGEQLSVYRTVD